MIEQVSGSSDVSGNEATWSATAHPVLAVNNLEVVYSDVMLVLRGLSLEMPSNSIVAILGSNGAGKTTLLRAITGLLASTAARSPRARSSSKGARSNARGARHRASAASPR